MKKGDKQYRCSDESQFAIDNNLAVHVLRNYQNGMIEVFESIKLNGNGGEVRQSSHNSLYAKIIEIEKSIKILKNTVLSTEELE